MTALQKQSGAQLGEITCTISWEVTRPLTCTISWEVIRPLTCTISWEVTRPPVAGSPRAFIFSLENAVCKDSYRRQYRE